VILETTIPLRSIATGGLFLGRSDNHGVVVNTQIFKEMIDVIRIEQERRQIGKGMGVPMEP